MYITNMDASCGVMVTKLDLQTIVCQFDSHGLP